MDIMTTARLLSDSLAMPEQAHRLDAATGGLLMVGKTRPALQALCNAFAQREVRRPSASRVDDICQNAATPAKLRGHPVDPAMCPTVCSQPQTLLVHSSALSQQLCWQQ